MTLVGVSGYARSGKDSVGKILVEQHGFQRLAFADAVKEALAILDPVVGAFSFGDTYRVSDALEWDSGWDEAKQNPEIRRLLQVLGTDVGRNFLDKDTWVRRTLQVIDQSLRDSIVVTDVRFPNELEAIRSRGGRVWRVRRRGRGPANGHASEISLDAAEFDVIIENNGTLDDLAEKVRGALDGRVLA